MVKAFDAPEYDFLRNGRVKNIILFGVSGSRGYGTNVATSDWDGRGIYLNPLQELIGTKGDSEQFADSQTDTTIYSFMKMIKLLSSCNPNTIELLGLRKSDYYILTDIGQELVDNADMFLSKRAIHTFGSYARSQLNRLVMKSGQINEELLSNEGRSMEKVLMAMMQRFDGIENYDIRILDDDIRVTMALNDMSISDIAELLNELNNVNRQYKKSVRNEKAIEHGKLAKHSMHLIRLFMMGVDILKDHEIRTYRTGGEHDLLMRIRNEEFLKDEKTVTPEFSELIQEYSAKFDEASRETTLPDSPDFERINDFVMRVNKRIIDESY